MSESRAAVAGELDGASRWGAGGVVAAAGAALSWICCLPFVAGFLGLGAAAAGAWLAPLRIPLALLATSFVAISVYRAFRPRPCAEGSCESARSPLRTRVLVVVLAVLTALLLTLPRWSSWLIYWSL